ncbi:MAG: helix-turn-helix transcriptional regulator [Pseudonocardiales bacterium]|nr:helix-turn-helix transcriptional regulator [Pseudonocardiales bacterium]
MAQESGQATGLARALRDLREKAKLTQAQLATVLSEESPVAAATISSYESVTSPKTPPDDRIRAYARFFASHRSIEEKRLLADDELSEPERKQLRAHEERLLSLVHTKEPTSTFAFNAGPITIICPDAPEEASGPLADPRNPNFTRLHQYADLDSLVEIWGHLWRVNPTLDIRYRLASKVQADDLSSHVILLGGIGWNEVTEDIQDTIKQVLPITQVNDPELKTGEIFVVGEESRYDPIWAPADEEGNRRLKEDVAFLARLRNPFNVSRTLTICNGVHSRGVYGAVRCLTDRRVSEENERYLADHFPEAEFALLLRVKIVSGETVSPDLQNPGMRLFEWAPGLDGGRR